MARKSLPTIEPLPNLPQTANLGQMVSHASIASSICSLASNTLNTQTSMATSTVCSTVVSSSTVDTPKMVEVVVVSDTSANQKTVSNTSAKPEYKLTEIVSLEKEQLFQSSGEKGLILEPPRVDVDTVRRRSRQFFTLREEEENDTEDTVINNFRESDVDGKTIQVDPIFNLGESLRRLYFPNEFRVKNKKKVVKKDPEENSETKDSKSEPIDDPQGCASLYKKISNMYGLRRVQSTPEIEDTDNVPNDLELYDYSTFSKSKSLPNTPKVSPKLLRKQRSQTTDEMPDQQRREVTGPGFSFLASVAGNVRMYKAKQEQQRQEEKRRYEKMVLAKSTGDRTIAEPTHHTERTNNNTGTQYKPATKSTDAGFRPRAYSDSDSESESSLVKNIISWGTKKRVRMSGKETNMFSPTSF